MKSYGGIIPYIFMGWGRKVGCPSRRTRAVYLLCEGHFRFFLELGQNPSKNSSQDQISGTNKTYKNYELTEIYKFNFAPS